MAYLIKYAIYVGLMNNMIDKIINNKIEMYKMEDNIKYHIIFFFKLKK